MNKYLADFLKHLEVEKNYSDHTLFNYRLDLEEFLSFLGHDDMTQVNYPTLRRYLAGLREKNLKPRSIARKLSSLRSFFRFLQREGVVEKNPALLLLTPKLDKTLPHFLTEQEATSLIEAPVEDKLAALRDKAGAAVPDVLVMAVPSHGFRDIDNNVNLYTKMLAFFGKHIGDKQATAQTP
mgnify:CR=1 FL=1